MAGDMACEVGGVDGLGSGLARLGLTGRFFHSARLGSVRPTSALLVSAWLGLLLGPPFAIFGFQAATPQTTCTSPRHVRLHALACKLSTMSTRILN